MNLKNLILAGVASIAFCGSLAASEQQASAAVVAEQQEAVLREWANLKALEDKILAAHEAAGRQPTPEQEQEIEAMNATFRAEHIRLLGLQSKT